MTRATAMRRVSRTLCFVVLASVCAAPAALAEAPKVHGVELLNWSKKLEDDRYQSPRNWDKTLEHFQKMFRGWRGVRWHREVNLPTIKYVHIENTNEKAEWAGINIYELPGGKVRMYVLKREAPADPAAESGAAQKPPASR